MISIYCKNCTFSYFDPEGLLKAFLTKIGNEKKLDIYQNKCLNDINFDLNEGERIGVVGLNGSGKSTLLLALNGNLNKLNGELYLNNPFQILSELGEVDSTNNTGYEIINSYYFFLLTFQKDEIKAPNKKSFIKSVENFSELGGKLNKEFRTYSSGMKARLLYSLRVASLNNYLLIDEVLSVGDNYFVEKCIRNLRSYNKYNTGIFVSHNWSVLSKICSKFIWLDNGRIVKYGSLKNVIGSYLTNYSNWLQEENIIMEELKLEKNVFSLQKDKNNLRLKFSYKNACSLNPIISLGLENISANNGWENILQTSQKELNLLNKEKGFFQINMRIPTLLIPSEYELCIFFSWIDNESNNKTFSYSWFNHNSIKIKILE